MTSIYTAPITFGGPDRVDITFAGVEAARSRGLPPPPGAELAPSAALRSWTKGIFYRDGDTEQTRIKMWPEYSDRYLSEIRERYLRDPAVFRHLLDRKQLVLVCYCKDPRYCHRSLAADILVRSAAGRATYHGETSAGAELLAITLLPEWAYAYAYFGKDVENRSWRSEQLKGKWFAIHGGKCIGGIQHGEGAVRDDHRQVIADMLKMAQHAAGITVNVTPRDILTHGRGIVALAKLDRFIFGDARGWYVGRPQIGWSTPQVVVLDAPVPCRGAQGVWPVQSAERLMIASRLPKSAPDDLVRQIAA